MPTGVKISGGPDLKARLSAISRPFLEIGAEWQQNAVKYARSGAPSRTGHGRSSIHPAALTPRQADIRGAYYLIFIDRGTKAHEIRAPGHGTYAKKAKALRFEYRGQTIFAKAVHRRRMARRPFLTKAAQDAIRAPLMADSIIGLWNRKTSKARFRKLSL